MSRAAFPQALGMRHKRGTMSLVGLPPGDFALPIFDVVLNAKTIRGSIVGTWKDLPEAPAFAGEGRIHTAYTERRLDDINDVFACMKRGDIEGRVVLRISGEAQLPPPGNSCQASCGNEAKFTAPHAMCSMPSGMWTQECMRSS